MSLIDELERLQALRERGSLTDDEFARAKAKLLDAEARTTVDAPLPWVAAMNGLRRSRRDRWLAGVCGGLAQATGVQSWVWRLGFALVSMFGGVGIVAYALMWIFVPTEGTAPDAPVHA